MFGHYVSFLAAFIGIHVKNYNPEVPYTIFELVLLIVTAVMALAKLIIIIVRAVKDPIHYPRSEKKVKFEKLKPADVSEVQY